MELSPNLQSSNSTSIVDLSKKRKSLKDEFQTFETNKILSPTLSLNVTQCQMVGLKSGDAVRDNGTKGVYYIRGGSVENEKSTLFYFSTQKNSNIVSVTFPCESKDNFWKRFKPYSDSVEDESVSNLEESLLQSMYNTLETDGDVTLLIGLEKKAFKFNSLLLNFHSTYFKALYSGKYTETLNHKFEYPDLHPVAVSAMQKFCYFGTLDDSDTDNNILEIWALANRFQLKLLEVFVKTKILSLIPNTSEDALSSIFNAGKCFNAQNIVNVCCFQPHFNFKVIEQINLIEIELLFGNPNILEDMNYAILCQKMLDMKLLEIPVFKIFDRFPSKALEEIRTFGIFKQTDMDRIILQRYSKKINKIKNLRIVISLLDLETQSKIIEMIKVVGEKGTASTIISSPTIKRSQSSVKRKKSSTAMSGTIYS